MAAVRTAQRPALRLVHSSTESWTWFCSRCGFRHQPISDLDVSPRVCSECSFGLVLRTRSDAAPGADGAFVVVDSSLTVQAVSEQGEAALGLREIAAVNRHVTELLIPADVEAASRLHLAEAITDAAGGEVEPVSVSVRPSGAFGIRLQARIAACGPPPAALLVLD